MKVVVLIPMFNHAEMTKKCIQLCKENAGIEHEILVVDDGSSEPFDSVDAKIIKINHNGGFTKAVNTGLRALELDYDYICILNNDTEPQKDFLKIMVEDMERSKAIGIVSAARVHNAEEFMMQTSGADLTTGEVYVSKDESQKDILMTVFVPFCCVTLSKHCVQTIGLLDERMVNHCSDNDYCLRAVLMDIGVVVDTAARVKHYQSVTIHEKGILPYDDQKTFAAKWFGPMMNEILALVPINRELNKWGQIGFKYEVREEGPRIEVVRS